MNIWTFLLAVIAIWLAFEFGLHYRRKKRRRVCHIKIVKEYTMLTVGVAAPFHVQAFDTNGDPMPMPPTLGVAVDNGTASVNADGTGGQETPATVGTATLTATLTLADGTVFTDAVTDSVQAAAPVLAGIKIVMD